MNCIRKLHIEHFFESGDKGDENRIQHKTNSFVCIVEVHLTLSKGRTCYRDDITLK